MTSPGGIGSGQWVSGDGNVVIANVSQSHITIAAGGVAAPPSSTGRVSRVFVSSTAQDLGAWRAAVVAALGRVDTVKPVNQEAFGSRSGDTVDQCQRLASTADVVVVIVAHRYGWVPTIEEGGDGQRSITALEVAAAHAHDVPVLAFVVDEDFGWTQRKEQDDVVTAVGDADKVAKVVRRVELLNEFKQRLSGGIVARFTTPDDLAAKVSTSVYNALDRQARPDAPTKVERVAVRGAAAVADVGRAHHTGR